MSKEEIENLLNIIQDLHTELSKLKEQREPRLFGLTDRMTERLIWLFVFILGIMALNPSEEILVLFDMIMGMFG